MADPTYAGGGAALIAHWQQRRAPIVGDAGDGLPGLEVDLDSLRLRILPQAVPDLPKQHNTKI